MSFENSIKSTLKLVNRVFGVSVTYTYTQTGETSDITGVFDNAFVEVLGVNTLKPILKINLADLLYEPSEDDTVLINSVNYKVLNDQRDSFGSTTLILEKS